MPNHKVRPLRERFEENYIPEPMSGCWLWIGHLSSGYGQLTNKHWKDLIGAHRASWLLHKGEIPDGLVVCHKCDTRSCVNPDHLFLGTCKDNMVDAASKGRMARGSRNGSSKLSEPDIRAIRASGESIRGLARKFNVSQRTIQFIVRGVTWVHVQ
jgi:hypothetical protein